MTYSQVRVDIEGIADRISRWQGFNKRPSSLFRWLGGDNVYAYVDEGNNHLTIEIELLDGRKEFMIGKGSY
jgi:hypothetical protein